MDGFLLMELMAEQREADLRRRSRGGRQREEALALPAPTRAGGLRSRLAGLLLALALRLDRAGTATRLTVRPL